ncbi:MAG: hypothetical protein Q9217_003413 [Psora testacea]
MPVEEDVKIPFPPRDPVQCVLMAKDTEGLSHTPSLIFTHGAGGTVKADAVRNFAHGFAKTFPILCFQGPMNLKSRVKIFGAVVEDRKALRCLGGRSMGARAAIMAATSETTHLVLVSYPLHNGKEIRDEILLNLPDTVKVFFVSGDRDSMCDIGRLQDVRRRMKCRTWLLVVEGADHGMNTSPKAATREIGEKTGEIGAEWLENSDENATESKLVWNVDEGKARWSGWSAESVVLSSEEISGRVKANSPRSSKGEKRANPAERDLDGAVQDGKDAKRKPSKRRKRKQ